MLTPEDSKPFSLSLEPGVVDGEVDRPAPSLVDTEVGGCSVINEDDFWEMRDNCIVDGVEESRNGMRRKSSTRRSLSKTYPRLSFIVDQ